MLISTDVEVKLTSANIKYYENLGYRIPRVKRKRGNKLNVKHGTIIMVKIEDVQKGSHVEVLCLCDYCLDKGIKTEVRMPYKVYNTNVVNNPTGRVSCRDSNCIKQKVEESNSIKYGYKQVLSIPTVIEKKLNTCLENNGVEYPSQNLNIKDKTQQTILKRTEQQKEEIQQKRKITNLKIYGFENAMKNINVKEKQVKTMYSNGKTPTSSQQIYLHNLLGGGLNYPVSHCSLDIAFIDQQILIEYNGGFHDGKVQMGLMTQQEFENKERRRQRFLKDRNWKQITINSKSDKLPLDKIIIEMIEYAKQYLSSGHSWIEFDISNQIVKCSQFEKDYDFGELRKIKKKAIVSNLL